jgi:hypothetical protein
MLLECDVVAIVSCYPETGDEGKDSRGFLQMALSGGEPTQGFLVPAIGPERPVGRSCKSSIQMCPNT